MDSPRPVCQTSPIIGGCGRAAPAHGSPSRLLRRVTCAPRLGSPALVLLGACAVAWTRWLVPADTVSEPGGVMSISDPRSIGSSTRGTRGALRRRIPLLLRRAVGVKAHGTSATHTTVPIYPYHSD